MTKFASTIIAALIVSTTVSSAQDVSVADLDRLYRQAPADARVAYMVSLSLVDRMKYRDAWTEARRSVNLDPSNLTAWKSRIWLSLATKNYQDALKSIEWLVGRMPAKAATPQAEQACVAFCSFTGTAFGFLAGPADEAVSRQQRDSIEQRVVQQLSASRRDAFLAARNKVLSRFESQMEAIAITQRSAQENEARFRNEELIRLDEENRYAHAELDKVEDTRLRQRELAANERNIIAATREESAGGTVANSGTHFRALDLRRPIFRANATTPTIIGHRVQRGARLNHRSNLASGFATDRGLDNAHYLNVNDREAAQDERLDDRERDMQRRLRRIAKDKAKQFSRPNAGMTASVRAMTSKAKALYTYIDFPVNVDTELASMIALYR